MDLYAPKAALNERLAPVVGRLADAGISPDAVTLAAIPVALAGGACLLFSQAVPGLLLLVPLLAAVRLVLNLLDGQLARRTGRIHPRGELLNELADRLADIAFLVPVAALPGARPEFVLGGVLMALLASFVGVAAKSAGGERIYAGVLSKPGRMLLLAGCSLWALVAEPARAWSAFAFLLLVGATLTVIERVTVAWRRLP